MTEEEAIAAFRADLDALLRKWGADISARDHWTGYSECGEDVRMTVSICFTAPDGLPSYVGFDIGAYVEAGK